VSLGKLQKDMRNVLLYTQDLMTLNEKVIYDLEAEPNPVFHEVDLSNLEGIDIGFDGDTWLWLRRLRETQPPAPDAMFDGWLKPIAHPTPDTPPVLVEHRMLRLGIEEISDLVEAGLLDMEDIMMPRDADEAPPAQMDAILRTGAMPEFRALFDEYIAGPWSEWAEVERPRRKSIAVYNKLFQLQQRMTAAGDDNAIELVWGIGVARWRHPAPCRLNVALIEQLVDIELDDDGTLLIGPRQTAPHLALKPFHALEIDGSKSLQRDGTALLERIVQDPDLTFSPFERKSFEPVLKASAARLSSAGIYVPDESGRDPSDRSLPEIDGVLRITDTWVLYARHRAEDFRKEDIQRLIKKIEATENETELPAPALQFIKPPSNERLYADGSFDLGNASWGGPRSHDDGFEIDQAAEPVQQDGNDADYFFPLPHNDEQRQILTRLAQDDGVVVQGPPGTGKTHTIANVICHFLALGKRVLVTAKTAEALNAIQEKLPPGIRELAISVIHNDREGARQLEHAVQVLASEAKQINIRAIRQEILDKQQFLSDVRDRISEIDGLLLSYAQRNLEEVESGGQKVLPMMLAQQVIEGQAVHGWFTDHLSLEAHHAPRFIDADIQEARAIRKMLGLSLAYRVEDLPNPEKIPDVARILAAHGELGRLRKLDEKEKSGNVPYMATTAVDLAREVREWLAELAEFMSQSAQDAWLMSAYKSLNGRAPLDEASSAVLQAALKQWAELYKQGHGHLLNGITIGDVPIGDHAFDQAVTALAEGEKPFGMFSFNKGALKERLKSVLVNGSAPDTPEAWQHVNAFRAWQRDALAFLRHWSSICGTTGFPVLPTTWDEGRPELMRLGRLIIRMLWLASSCETAVKSLQTVFPYGIDAKATVLEGNLGLALEALDTNLERADLVGAKGIREDILSLAGGKELPFHTALADVAIALGDTGIEAGAIAEAWRQIQDEAARLHGLKSYRERLNEIAELVRLSGAPEWAQQLATSPVKNGDDHWTPASWKEAWDWARASGFVRSISDRTTIQRLSLERTEKENQLRSTLAEVVRLRTFLGLKQSLTGRIEAALAKFASAVARLGAGTGKSAVRQRRVIRDSALEAADAVPCWILPEWRVSEQLPAELCAFDLVIIDEASQSDVTALPAILRGKKLLIVGDDKQVSPTPVGLDEKTVIQLRTTYLTGLPFADQMDPATSLYELASMMFPGKTMLLREHFRCVEPIIRFSSRFYGNALVPMRLPSSVERLDPPLIDILVRDGEKKGDLNRREAEVIVEEIRKLTEDPDFARRTIGVISHIGDKQAKLIYDRLMRELGVEIIDRHKIMCGNAATFQGQERDIIFLSMVACPKTATMQRSRMFEQRLNVAMSRCRGRGTVSSLFVQLPRRISSRATSSLRSSSICAIRWAKGRCSPARTSSTIASPTSRRSSAPA
jgi:hypothetical protein